MTAPISKDQARQIVGELLEKAHKRFRQELAGENEEFFDRSLREHSARISRHGWMQAQKWCKWAYEGPVLMPDYTRLYYRKGNTEIVVQEIPPQVRIMKLKGVIAKRDTSSDRIDNDLSNKLFHYSLALPYIVFIFKFTNGVFKEVRCAFSDRPLKTLHEQPLRPYLSNIDSNLVLCLGNSFDRSQLEKDNLTQQCALVLSHFWHTSYNDEWSGHFWSNKTHFQNKDNRLSSIDNWAKATEEDGPLFVIEDVDWLRYQNDDEKNFGDMIVHMLRNENADNEFKEEVYNELTEVFLGQLKTTLGDNIDRISESSIKFSTDQLADDLIKKLQAL